MAYSFTYQQVFDKAITVLKSQCKNVSDFANMPSQFKSGYSTTITNGRAKVTYTISNPIASATETDLSNGFKSALAKVGLSDKLSSKATSRGLLDFYKAFVLFCSCSIRVCTSQFTSTQCIAYVAGTIGSITASGDGDTISPQDFTDASSTLVELMISNTKPYYVKYTATYAIA